MRLFIILALAMTATTVIFMSQAKAANSNQIVAVLDANMGAHFSGVLQQDPSVVCSLDMFRDQKGYAITAIDVDGRDFATRGYLEIPGSQYGLYNDPTMKSVATVYFDRSLTIYAYRLASGELCEFH